MKKVNLRKKAIFNAYTLAFAIIALTAGFVFFVAAVTFIEQYTDAGNRLVLTQAIASSESIKYYLDKAVAIEARAASFELNEQGGTDSKCHTYRSHNLWNSLDDEECFSIEKMSSLFTESLNEKMKRHYIGYPYEFIPMLNYEIEFEDKMLHAIPQDKLNLRDYKAKTHIVPRPEKMIEVPFEYTGKEGIQAPERLLLYYVMFNNQARESGLLFSIDKYEEGCFSLRIKGMPAVSELPSIVHSSLKTIVRNAGLEGNIEVKIVNDHQITFCLPKTPAPNTQEDSEPEPFDINNYFRSTYSIEVNSEVHEELEVEYEQVYEELNETVQKILLECKEKPNKERCISSYFGDDKSFSLLDPGYPEYEEHFYSFVDQFLEIQETIDTNCEKEIKLGTLSERYFINLNEGKNEISLILDPDEIQKAPNIPKTELTEINPCAKSRVQLPLPAEELASWLKNEIIEKITDDTSSPNTIQVNLKQGKLQYSSKLIQTEPNFIVGSDGEACFIDDIDESTVAFYLNLYLYSFVVDSLESLLEAASPEITAILKAANSLFFSLTEFSEDSELIPDFDFCSSLRKQEFKNLEEVFPECKEGSSSFLEMLSVLEDDVVKLPNDAEEEATPEFHIDMSYVNELILNRNGEGALGFKERLNSLRKPQCQTEKRFFALSARYNKGKMLDYTDFSYKDIVINFSIYIE